MEKKLKESVHRFSDGERQRSFLLKLNDTLRPLENPVYIEEAVTEMAMDFMDADRCHYSTIEGDNVIILHDAVRGDLPSVAGVHAISSFALYKAALKEGLPFVVDDVRSNNIISEDLKELCLQFQYGSFINVPVVKNGNPVGLLSLVQNKPRKWTEAEVQLTIETAERIWEAVERAKAVEALRRSEEKYRTLFTSIDQGFTLCELIRNEEGKGIDFYMLEVNPTYEKQTGVSKEMVLGKKILQVFPSLDKWLETYAAVVDNQRPVVFEHYFEDTDRWFTIKAYPVEKERFAVLFSDITERKLAEEKLKQSEKQFKNVLLQSPNIFVILEGYPEMIVTFANEKLFKSWARTEAIIGKPLLEILPEIKDQSFPQLLQRVFETGETYKSGEEKAVIIKDEAPVDTYFMYVYQPIFNDSHKVTGVTIMATDISEQVLARKIIENNAEKLMFNDTIFNSIPDAIVSSDLFGKVTSWNQCAEELYGYSKEEMMGQIMPDLIPTEFVNKEEDNWEKSFIDKGHWKGEVIQTCKEGKKIYVSAGAHVIHNTHGDLTGYVSVNRDITLQKEAEIKIKESENRFRTMADASPVLIWTIDAKGVSSYYNKTFLDFIGVTKEEAIYDWRKIVHPEDVESVSATINTAISARRSYSLECRLLRGDGHWRWVLAQGCPRLDDNNEFLGFVGSSVDITERKQVEEKIKLSEYRFHELIYSSPSMMAILRGESMIIEIANDAIIASWGKGKDVIGKSVFSVLPEIVEQGFDKLLLSVYRTGKPYHAYSTPVTLLRNGINELIYYHFVYQVQRNIDGEIEGVAILANEVTSEALLNKKIKESEEQLEKLVAERTKELQRSNDDLQQFAHVASHDLQEPVRKIKTFINRLQEYLKGGLDETATHCIERIHIATNRMTNMIEGVLAYSTTQASKQEPEWVDLMEVVKNIETDLEVVLQRAAATLHYNDLPTLEGAPELLYQLFNNLIYNSIKFAKSNVPLLISISSKAFVEDNKNFVRITIQDNGIGFGTEYSEQIFKPFTRLNSKDKYEGTGLGLSLCRNIVDRHSGTITASGIPDEGATFTITLPIEQKKEEL